MKLLTIVIPTYNRNNKVLELLELFKKLNFETEIIVIDNNSDIPLAKFLNEKKFELLPNIQIIRNKGNVGLGGNIIMSFMNCGTEWMWLLGDDDRPTEDSIQKINKQISTCSKNTFLIKFNSTAGKFPTENFQINDINSLLQFSNNFGYYSNLLFISNSVFKVPIMLKQTFFMMNSIRTMAPHLTGIYRNVEHGHSIAIVNEHIVEHGIPDINNGLWDYQRLLNGLLYFKDIEIHSDIKKSLLPELYLNYINCGRSKYKRLLKFAFEIKNLRDNNLSDFYFRSAMLFRINIFFFYLIILGVIFRIPLCLWCLNKMRKDNCIFEVDILRN